MPRLGKGGGDARGEGGACAKGRISRVEPSGKDEIEGEEKGERMEKSAPVPLSSFATLWKSKTAARRGLRWCLFG